ncbi:TSUP family transporter [Paraflavisolibacter sp. H34]|uniref:TSUP family transporter n=1 Tax=Huijunlia imazamoxiresistens TaxID=3127457 RepID=UPI00301ACDBD
MTTPFALADDLETGKADRNTSFPAFINLSKMVLLIAGGGPAALEKLREVLRIAPAAHVKIVGFPAGDAFRQLAAAYPHVDVADRPFQVSDLQEVSLVIVAEEEEGAVQAIRKAAAEQGILVYLAGAPALPAWAAEEAKNSVRWKKVATYSISVFALMLLGHILFSTPPILAISNYTLKFYQTLDANFHWMVLAGLVAQLVDGALGMGYGITSSAILLSTGINPAAISGSIHAAEMFASGASGYSHYKFGNVNKKLFRLLLIPGIAGAVLGALLLIGLGSSRADYVRPLLAAYTLLMGLRILYNAYRKEAPQKKFKQFGWLAGFGGFLDSFGGGGWGPIVTTTLITTGRSPRFVIGSVSLTEFFVTLSSAFTFFTFMGVSHWQVIAALVIGGLIGAPLAARLAGRLPRKTSMILLGVLVIFWSIRILVNLL